MKQATSQSKKLYIRDLHVSIENKSILNGVTLTVDAGKTHIIMGPNGSGKSTLTYALMGHPTYVITKGAIEFAGKNIIDFAPEERAKLGILLAFQNPIAVPGVTLSHFLRTAYKAMHTSETFSVLEFHAHLKKQAAYLKLDESFLKRSLNDGFSGGEKKKAEMLQLLVLKPKLAIFDEIDTGLDIDALKIVSKAISALTQSVTAVLLITHYQRILKYMKPDHVHVLVDGKIVRSGGMDLVQKIEESGYAGIG